MANLKEAFDVASDKLNVPRLLEPEGNLTIRSLSKPVSETVKSGSKCTHQHLVVTN